MNARRYSEGLRIDHKSLSRDLATAVGIFSSNMLKVFSYQSSTQTLVHRIERFDPKNLHFSSSKKSRAIVEWATSPTLERRAHEVRDILLRREKGGEFTIQERGGETLFRGKVTPVEGYYEAHLKNGAALITRRLWVFPCHILIRDNSAPPPEAYSMVWKVEVPKADLPAVLNPSEEEVVINGVKVMAYRSGVVIGDIQKVGALRLLPWEAASALDEAITRTRR
jgi:hypothetical protein